MDQITISGYRARIDKSKAYTNRQCFEDEPGPTSKYFQPIQLEPAVQCSLLPREIDQADMPQSVMKNLRLDGLPSNKAVLPNGVTRNQMLLVTRSSMENARRRYPPVGSNSAQAIQRHGHLFGLGLGPNHNANKITVDKPKETQEGANTAPT